VAVAGMGPLAFERRIIFRVYRKAQTRGMERQLRKSQMRDLRSIASELRE